ncbi:MAG: 8-oxo-dGTP diphosphatase [Candidatus Bathyarchaeota archaeon]|nr:8-oxo-dGTP diphosphatase [Candidatus Bathyarchaeota archaeon]
MTTEAIVCTIIREGRILLQRKTTGRFGEEKWNGPGGKLRPSETPEDCARREVHEETDLRVRDLRLHGALRHYFGKVDEPDWIVHQFSATEFEGEPKDSDEGELRWFLVDEIPYQEMWQDDEHWLPLLLNGRDFSGDFYFNAEGTELLRHCLVIEE